jgi:hypothetical protein
MELTICHEIDADSNIDIRELDIRDPGRLRSSTASVVRVICVRK